MRNKFWIPLLLLLPSIVWGVFLISPWNNVGNTLQRTPDNFKYRSDMGSGKGFVYWYQKGQVDSVANLKQPLITQGTTLQYFDGTFGLHTFPLALPPNGAAGGDLSGTYPNPTVSMLNGQVPSYYLTYGNLTGAPTDLGNFTNGPGYALINGTNTLRTAANFGQTASEADVAHWPTSSSGANTYEVSGWLRIASGSGYAITMQVTFVYSTVTYTLYFFPVASGSTTLPTSASLTTVNYYAFQPLNIRVSPSTTIQVSTVLASGTILYEDGATINLRK